MMIAASIFRAFVWEMSKNWHLLLLGLLGGILPLLLFVWLFTSVGLPIQSPEFIRTHAFLMPFTFLSLFLGTVGIQGPVRRLYSYPLSDSTIALWHMLTGIAMIAAGCSLIILGLNLQFRTGWPILGPTVYFAMAFAVMQPYARIARKTVSTILIIPVVGLILIFGFLTRYSISESQPKLWSELSLLELSLLVLVTIASIFLFNRSVKLDRHNLGRTDPLLELWERCEFWIRNRLPRFSFHRSELRNGFEAHCWFLWQLNRSYLYVSIVILFFACAIYAFTAEPPATHWESKFVLSSVYWFPLILSSVLAMTMGIGLGSSDGDSTPSRDKATFEETLRSMNLLTMGSFLSTLPISNTRLSNTILLTAFRGVLMSAILTVIAAIGLYLVEIDLITDVWRSELFGTYCLLMLALPWSAVGVTSTICLIGRNRLLIAFGFSLVAGVVLIGLPLTRPLTIAALACGTTWINLVLIAKRNARMKQKTSNSHTTEDRWQVGFAMVLWLVLLAFSCQMPTLRSSESLGTGFLLLSSASVLPIIALPWSIGVNRTR